jgi:hypothetical protein
MAWTIPESARHEACVAVAFAIACGVPLDEFIARLEALGGKFIGTYHGQQCMDVAWEYGYATTIIQRNPYIVASDDPQASPVAIDYPKGNDKRFMNYLKAQKGVLGGIRDKGLGYLPIGHAVAWDTKAIYDPRGFVYSYQEATEAPHTFYANNLFMLTKVVQG